MCYRQRSLSSTALIGGETLALIVRTDSPKLQL